MSRMFRVVIGFFAMAGFLVAVGDVPEAVSGGIGDHVIKFDAIGCRDRTLFERIARLLVDNDTAAYEKLAVAGEVSGQCNFFKQGQVVFMEEHKMPGGMTCARPQGETSCFWTYSDAVERGR
jgi:hypothetical protein